MFRNNVYGKFTTEKDPQKGRAQSCFPTGYGSLRAASKQKSSGAPNENIVQNHLNIALLKVF